MDKLRIIYYLLGFYLNKITNRKQLSSFRREQLANLEKFLIDKSPYYGSKITSNGGLLHLPIISKTDYFRNFDTINTVGIKYDEATQIALRSEESRDFSPMIGNIAVGLSSGTSGNRGLFITSPTERARWVAAMIYKVIGWSWKKRTIAFFLRSNNQLYEQSNSGLIRFVFFDLSRPFDELIPELKNADPDILIAQPSVLLAISEWVKNGKLKINPSKLISVAEVLESDIKDELTITFRQKIHEVYQCTEGFLACTCKEGNLHLNEDVVFFQERFLDEDKIRFHPIITDMARRSQPVVRYELNDVLTYKEGKCKCGSPFKMIDKIEGRADDVLIFQRTNSDELVYVFGDFIRKIFLIADEKNEIINYKIHQNSLNDFQISIVIEGHFEIMKAKLLLHLNEYCISNNLVMPQITFANTIEFDPMKKFRRITRSSFQINKKINYL